MGQAHHALVEEKKPAERARILEAMAIACFDRYRAQRAPTYLDSAQYYEERAIKEAPAVSGYYYNLARVFTEKKDFGSAKANYEKTLVADPKHFMAYHNLGMLSLYELKDADEAQTYFEKALALDSSLPVDNYMLAQIALQKKNVPAAIRHYDRELRLYAGPQSASSNLVADRASERLAATLSALELAMLYSTATPNASQARSYFDDYLKLETDENRKQSSAREFQNHWPNNSSTTP
jgi:tetratricopeptide (TPR) repeat protein